MKKLILVCGPAAIGKSTFSNKYRLEHPEEDVHVIAADEVRKAMYGGYDQFPPGHNMLIIYEEMVRQANALCEQENVTVIFDTTMLFDERRLYFRRHLPNFDVYWLVLLKLHDYKQCLIRNKKRPKDKWVPENVILDMASHYDDPSEECKRHFSQVDFIYVD